MLLTPKVELKLLREDAFSRSFLLRLHPGAVLPPHEHPLEEECYCLEGEVRFGDLVVRAGDYHLAPPGRAPRPGRLPQRGTPVLAWCETRVVLEWVVVQTWIALMEILFKQFVANRDIQVKSTTSQITGDRHQVRRHPATDPKKQVTSHT